MLRTFLHYALKTVSAVAVVFCVVSLIRHRAESDGALFHAVWRPDDSFQIATLIIAGLIGFATWMASDLIGD